MNHAELLLLARARRYAASGEGQEIRVRAGLSVREVAEAVGVARHTLWKWERGERVPRADGATAWASFLGELAKVAS
ncbi:MAG: hypothetical protein JWL79_3080 [Frankiales bacterium]|nr:hypothetical protein [Frankiales bacterium]